MRKTGAALRAQRVDAAVTTLVQRGFRVVRFSEHHYRVEHRFDYWPSTGLWRSMDGKQEGHNLDPLIRALGRDPFQKRAAHA